MSVINNNLLLTAAAGATGYQVSRSLRFNSADSAYLSRTPASAGNRKTWTLSFWFKKAQSAAILDYVFGASSDGFNNNYALLALSTSFEWQEVQGGSIVVRKTAAPAIRDHSAWMHILINFDTDNSTADDRFRIYFNGTRITTFTPHNINPSLGFSGLLNNNIAHFWGYSNSSFSTNCYLAEIHFIDGQALDPTNFTTTDSTTGQLIPKLYSGSFGTNGYKLTFSDNSAATAAALGKDTANSNNWTPNNFSVTAGAGNDSLVDTPTSYGTDTGAGGEVRGNYSTLNPLATVADALSNGNLDWVSGTAANRITKNTFGLSAGKWYAEFLYTGTASGTILGICTVGATGNSGVPSTGYTYFQNGNKFIDATGSSYGASWTNGDVIGIALNLDSNQITFYKNNASQGAISITSGLTWNFCCIGSSTNDKGTWNFGQRPFAFPVSGFKALCDTNLPTPVVAKPNTVMDVALYTGNGSSKSVSGLQFSPELVWMKSRSAVYSNHLVDVVRGGTKALVSDSTASEYTSNNYVTSFDSAGFTIGNEVGINNNNTTYVAWCWDAGTSTVTNNVGSITSSVRANASAGFSIVTFNTGAAGNKTIGHGLGVAPQMIIFKNRVTASTEWAVYHIGQSSPAHQYYLRLNGTNAQTGPDTRVWANTAPSSTVFSIESGYITNANNDCVAYCFAPVAGYSSMGSYVGNGSSDGPFVYCGFRPRWILVKKTTDSRDWVLYDSARDTYNVSDKVLYPNYSLAEGTTAAVDMLSNGFKIRTTSNNWNDSSGTYIYFAVAESPFQYARAR